MAQLDFSGGKKLICDANKNQAVPTNFLSPCTPFWFLKTGHASSQPNYPSPKNTHAARTRPPRPSAPPPPTERPPKLPPTPAGFACRAATANTMRPARAFSRFFFFFPPRSNGNSDLSFNAGFFTRHFVIGCSRACPSDFLQHDCIDLYTSVCMYIACSCSRNR